MYRVTDQEIDTFISGYASIHSTFFGLCFGSTVALALTLVTAHLTDRMFSAFIAVTLVTVLGSLYFGFRWRTDQSAARKRAVAIRDRE